MNKNSLVSIIVPIYNIAQYLDRCVQSLVKQTYLDIEIILVDDGSTDNSGKMCDEWEKKDKRIRVIHKINGGLSAARNSGIEVARGDYYVFVDSDDWIAPDMIQVLMSRVNDADLVCCGMYVATDEKSDIKPWFDKELVLDTEEALDLLIENKIFTSHVMNKIYPRALFENIRFPEGKVFEDIRIMHNILKKCEKILIIPDAYYYYYVRSDSISNVVRLKNRLEWMEALKERYEDMKSYKDWYGENLISQMAVVISLAVVQNRFTKDELQQYKEDLLNIKKFLREQKTNSAVKKYATKAQYAYYVVAKIFLYKASPVYNIFQKR